MLNRHNLNIAKLASKEASRFTLSAIRVTPKETVVTDGRLLVTVSHSDLASEQFPDVSKAGVTATDTFEPFNFSAENALKAAKMLPKRPNLPILACAAICSNGDGKPKVVTTDLENLQIHQSMDGSFPDWERIIPERGKDVVFTIHLDARLLKALMERFIDLHDDNSKALVSFEFRKPTEAVRMDAENNGQHMTALLMPLRKD